MLGIFWKGIEKPTSIMPCMISGWAACSSSPLQKDINYNGRELGENEAFSFEVHIRNAQPARKATGKGIK